MNSTAKESADAQILPFSPLGLDLTVKERLREISGERAELHYQREGSEEPWHATASLQVVRDARPMFVTNTWSAIDPDHANTHESSPPRWHMASTVWLDIDAQDLNDSIAALHRTRILLRDLGIDPEQCSLFASGSKGFHVAVPLTLLVPGGVGAVGAATSKNWPRICREFVLENLLTDCTDMAVYSGGKGRMWRQPNVQRDNGAFKVAMPWSAVDTITPASYAELCNEPRELLQAAPVTDAAPTAAFAWATAFAKVYRAVKTLPKRQKTNDLTSTGALLPRVRARVLQALKRLDVNAVDYSDWIRVGSSLKSTGATDALSLWCEWSKGYRGRRRCSGKDCESRWDGLNGACSLGTLFHLAANGDRA